MANIDPKNTEPEKIFEVIEDDPGLATLIFDELRYNPFPSAEEQRAFIDRLIDPEYGNRGLVLAREASAVNNENNREELENLFAFAGRLVQKAKDFLVLDFAPEVDLLAEEYLQIMPAKTVTAVTKKADIERAEHERGVIAARNRAAQLVAQAIFTKSQQRAVIREAEGALPEISISA